MGRTLIIALCCALMATSCASKRTRPPPQAIPAEALSDTLFDSCRSPEKGPPTKDDAVCNKKKMAEVDVGILRLGRKIEKLEATGDARNQVFSVKLMESEGRVQRAEAEAEKYKGQRWWWGGGGILVGVLVTVLVAFAFR